MKHTEHCNCNIYTGNPLSKTDFQWSPVIHTNIIHKILTTVLTKLHKIQLPIISYIQHKGEQHKTTTQPKTIQKSRIEVKYLK